MSRLHKHLLVGALLSSTIVSGIVSGTALADDHTLFREPTISKDHIVFSYAGDLWRVARKGGEAERLTTGVGEESNPFISPDGSKVLFTGEYDGNVDVYVVDMKGGTPKRLTYHPGPDQAVGWSRDGKEVMFSSRRNSYANFLRMFTMKIDDTNPQQVPLPSIQRGSFSSDGKHIAYEPLNQWQPRWKRYHGGQQDKIWIAKLSDSSITKVPHTDSSDMYPMWIGDKVYFISDRNSEEGVFSLFAYDTKSQKVEQVLDNGGRDILSASAGSDGSIVYEQFGTIHVFDPKSKRASKVNITVNADVTSTRPYYKKVGERISYSDISPTGKRAVFEARGDILTVPADKGDIRNLTNTPGVMERSPVWSPDGQSIAYFSEASGEYALHVIDQKGHDAAKEIKLSPQFYMNPVWSPDSKKIAFRDRGLNLWYVDISADKPTPVKVDKNPINFGDVLDVSWSPDSSHIAYAKTLPNVLRGIFVYSLDSRNMHQITDGMSDARYPTFDKNGTYLYFTASTDIGEALSWADMSGMGRRTTSAVYAAVLQKDAKSPMAPESDEEAAPKQKPSGDKAKIDEKTDKADKDGDDQKGMTIDYDGIEHRIVAMPAAESIYVGLEVGGKGELYAMEMVFPDRGRPSITVHAFDPKKRSFKEAAKGLRSIDISADGKKALVQMGPNRWSINNTAALGKPDDMLKTAAMEVRVEPEAEWPQMFHEIWRGERDFFYDENLHGLDLDWAKKTYGPYVKSVKHRSDLTYLFVEMLNQLTIGHTYIRGGDQAEADRVSVGLLGADFAIEDNRYKLAKIYTGESWNPELQAPLMEPGLNINEGDFILSVNGRDLTADQNVYQAFEATAGKQVRISVASSSDGKDAREVVVVPVASDSNLRHIDWIEGNRRKTDELSGGKLAYVYIPNTSTRGYTNFRRYYFAQTDKHGAVLDERFNGGGSLADYVIQSVKKSHLANIFFRNGDMTVPVPAGAIYGPKAMIINERAGSGGDAMPWFFKKDGAGKLIGKQTWGGLVAAQRLPTLMDGGAVTAPDAAIFGTEGEWEVENHGVKPDVEVDLDPAAWRQGRDTQLEATIQHLLEELKKNPHKEMKVPDMPLYKRKK